MTPTNNISDYIKKAKLLKGKNNITELENEYWDKLEKRTVTYCADITAELCDRDSTKLNIENLKTALDTLPEKFAGISYPYAYIGMLYSSFNWVSIFYFLPNSKKIIK